MPALHVSSSAMMLTEIVSRPPELHEVYATGAFREYSKATIQEVMEDVWSRSVFWKGYRSLGLEAPEGLRIRFAFLLNKKNDGGRPV